MFGKVSRLRKLSPARGAGELKLFCNRLGLDRSGDLGRLFLLSLRCSRVLLDLRAEGWDEFVGGTASTRRCSGPGIVRVPCVSGNELSRGRACA